MAHDRSHARYFLRFQISGQFKHDISCKGLSFYYYVTATQTTDPHESLRRALSDVLTCCLPNSLYYNHIVQDAAHHVHYLPRLRFTVILTTCHEIGRSVMS